MKRISSNVYFMGLVSFFNDIASEMIYPIVPIYLKTVLGAPASVVGLIEGVAESTASILKIVSGWLTDKYQKRKPFVVWGYSLSTLGKLFLAFAASWPMVLLARFVDRVGKGIRTTARDALIVDSVEPKEVGRAFGLHRAMDTMGAVVGPLLAIWLISYFAEDYNKMFLVASIPALIGVVALVIFVREGQRAETKSAILPTARLSFRGLNRNFVLFLVATAIFSIGNSADAFLILRSQNLGLSATLAVTAYVLFNIFYSSISYPAGIVADRFGPRRVIIAGYAIFAIVYFGFGLATTPSAVWILFPFYGLYMALTDGISRAYISEVIPREHIGTAIGLHQTVVGFCLLFSSIIAGVLWDVVSPATPFLFGGIMAAASVIVFLAFVKKHRPENF